MATQFKEKTISSNEREFLLAALQDGIRPDGRGLNTSRRTQVTFEESTWGMARVTLGNTQVVCTISSEVVEPSAQRGSEGLVSFNVQFPPIASPYFSNAGKTAPAVEISRIIERCIKDTHCVDTETLCIVAKERVWSLTLDIRILNYDGNVVDACCLASVAALMYYRRPEITVTSNGITIHNEVDKNFIPLRLGCIPITSTFALFDKPLPTNQDPYCVLDPTLLEDLSADGMMTIATTPEQEILCVNATGSNGYETDLVFTNSRLAVERSQLLYQHLKAQYDEILKKKQHKIW